MKTEVYSWRVSTELKSELEREARRQKVPVSAILDQAARQWLKQARDSADDEKEQRRLHRSAEKFFGTLSLGDPHLSTKVSQVVRERLRAKYGR
jgi:hypothetical protein